MGPRTSLVTTTTNMDSETWHPGSNDYGWVAPAGAGSNHHANDGGGGVDKPGAVADYYLQAICEGNGLSSPPSHLQQLPPCFL
ncbi:hypothetical protein NLG97_g4144 [Lecanicillium saksenae]|uniref:Uncharacterized protein n=1 Tax=Lecanicillium saksenae TaxID=468837 RepID=A0ACC1QXB7_9HYPO|nr:hypothetical protein NLG97_g4144 [Lecanicillium saksenae]